QIVRLVAERMRLWQAPNLVVDPVMVASSGDRLQTEDALAALREALLPQVRVLTANLPEAAGLRGRAVPDEQGVVMGGVREDRRRSAARRSTSVGSGGRRRRRAR